jgi:hypothetical protein
MGFLTKTNIPICCGFASQMGQYAGLYSIAKESGLDLVFIKESLYGNLFGGAYNYALDIPFKHKPKIISLDEANKVLWKKIDPKIDHDLIDKNLFRLNNNFNFILDGDVALYRYFDKYSNEIKELFTFNDNIINKAKSFIKNNLSDDEISVSIAFRRGDYLHMSSLNLSLDYFYKAVDKIQELFPNKKIKYFIFSGAAFGDSGMDWVKENFKIDNKIYVEGFDKFEQLCIMSMCNHNIISNSSFPWWAAYLNSNPDKRVICPFNYAGDSRPDITCFNGNYYPSEWIAINQN